MSFNLDDYVDVAERIRIFREKYPDGSLQSEVTMLGTAVLVKAFAYRTPDDPRPGVGHSLLTIPGKTPYTKDSEVENAETSAWGRAIVAALAADTKKVASADEVQAKSTKPTRPAAWPSKADALKLLALVKAKGGDVEATRLAMENAKVNRSTFMEWFLQNQEWWEAQPDSYVNRIPDKAKTT